MNKPRDQYSAAEIEALYEKVDRKLDKLGLETQPEVASRILELAGDPEAGPVDFAEVLKQDASLTGRLLRVSNSAYFAQKTPVTNLERACVVLGMQRLKAVALGFYLGRGTQPPGGNLSRRVWGQSLFRACLATEVARMFVPERSAEAFVIGLMLDSGIPLMPQLVGDEYEVLTEMDPTPTVLIRMENERYELTHADVVTVMVRRWKLPELLCKPIEWRYIPPGSAKQMGETQKLQRVAHYAGAVAIDGERGVPVQRVPLSEKARNLLDLGGKEIEDIVSSASQEYGVISGLFGDFAENINDIDSIANHAHTQLTTLIERTLVGLDEEQPGVPSDKEFQFGRFTVEIRADGPDTQVALVRTGAGEELISYRFLTSTESPDMLLESLGVEHENCAEYERLKQLLESEKRAA